jgi:tRNA G18 (ribose-2'-O)-methylase SpoU
LSVLLAEKRVAGLMPALAGLPPDVPVYAAGQAVMDAIAGFPLHRGILALGRRGPPVAIGDLLGGSGPVLVVGLFGIANHDNIGGLFRNAAGFGARGVILDAACCDPLYRKAIRVSVGTALTVPFVRLDPGTDAVALFESHGTVPVALSPAGSCDLADFMPPPRVAALFGAEGPGLPSALLGRVRSVRIAMAAGIDSLNVATTSGIVLHHLARVVTPSSATRGIRTQDGFRPYHGNF